MANTTKHPLQPPSPLIQRSTSMSEQCASSISPFSQILESNYAAPAAEACQIRQIVSQQDNDIARIDKEIDRVQRVLEQLQHDKDEIMTSRRAHIALISLVRCTPSEIWAQIFVMCLPEDEFVEINLLKAPLLLGQICSGWREIALSTPALWSSIRLGEREREFSPAQMPLIEAWLERSGNLPLSIQIIHPAASTSRSSDFLDVLIPFSSKWYNLNLDLPQSLAETIVCNNDISMPSLTTLSLSLSTVLDEHKPLLFSQKAAGLRNIIVFVDSLIPALLNFPWAQITDFRSDSIADIHDCLDIFQLCPQLINLQLRNISQDPFDGNDRALARMPQLSWLRIFSHGDPGPLLDNLVVPNLRVIHLEVELDTAWPKSQLIAMLARSSSPLRILGIQHIARRTSINEADIAECFENIPTLRNMVVAEFCTTTLYHRHVAPENSESGGRVYEQILVSQG